MNAQRKQLWRTLSRVDWIRAGQRLCTFAREMRGDDAAAIAADSEHEIQRSKRLRQSIEQFAEHVTKGGV
jgi:hypothetical protein